jgi:hypothetical protein
MWLKLAKIDQKLKKKFEKSHFFTVFVQTCLCVPQPDEKCENCRKSSKIGQFWPILATFYEFKSRFEKVGKASPGNLFSIF